MERLHPGLAFKHLANIGGGVIDFDYAAIFEWFFSVISLKISRSKSVILEKIKIVEVVEVDELPYTERRSEGFHLMGKNDFYFSRWI